MNLSAFFLYVGVMAGVTYLIRMLPLAVFKNKIENDFIRQFLFYVPYAALGAMTFPAIFSATGTVISAFAGMVTAVFLALNEKSLVVVAVCACAVVFLTERLLALF